jgi:flagellar motility protein MotE (MotC chaperone)
MRTVHKLGSVLLVVGALLCVEASRPSNAKGQAAPLPDKQPESVPPGYGHTWAGQPKHQELQRESARLAQQYAKSEKEEEKKEIRKKLGEVLGQQFDLHLQEQQKELDELEKQIADLKTLLKKRKDSRTTIIDRRLEQLVQDAEGLGWNTPGNRTPNAPLYSNHNAGTEYTAPARR